MVFEQPHIDLHHSDLFVELVLQGDGDVAETCDAHFRPASALGVQTVVPMTRDDAVRLARFILAACGEPA